MIVGSSLLLTREGYKRIDSISDPVEVISQITSDGIVETSHQIATITPRFADRTVYTETASGKTVVSSRGSGGFFVDPRASRRERWTHKPLEYSGTWVPWTQVEDRQIMMSYETPFTDFTVTEDDWAFYTYGITDCDDPDMAFPIPFPAASVEEIKYKPVAERRQEWPDWYWECTPAEKAMFLRGMYDAYGRITKTRIYFTAPTNLFSQQMVIALSEFGIKASRFITQQILWDKRPREYVVDIRGMGSINRMVDTFYWAERSRPSYRVDEVHRHANRFFHEGKRHTSTAVRIQRAGLVEPLYHIVVNHSHNAIINGLIIHDDTAF